MHQDEEKKGDIWLWIWSLKGIEEYMSPRRFLGVGASCSGSATHGKHVHSFPRLEGTIRSLNNVVYPIDWSKKFSAHQAPRRLNRGA